MVQFDQICEKLEKVSPFGHFRSYFQSKLDVLVVVNGDTLRSLAFENVERMQFLNFMHRKLSVFILIHNADFT